MQGALYARVSTSQQEQTDTIESQVEALHAYGAASDHTVWPVHTSCLIMGAVAVGETAPLWTVCDPRRAWATSRPSSCSRPIGEPAVLRISGCGWQSSSRTAAASSFWTIPLGMLPTVNSWHRGRG